MLVDYHTHILPNMDDGAASADMAADMLQMEKEQGVGTVVLTPHYDIQAESIPAFLARRQVSYRSLMGHQRAGEFPTLVLGAEVLLRRDSSSVQLLPQLCMGDSRHILLELPHTPFHHWMMQEIENIAYRFNLTPVVAHLDRYIRRNYITMDQAEMVLAFADGMVQVNNSAVEHHATKKWTTRLLKKGYPLLFGSDAHDLTGRKPNFDILPARLLNRYRSFAI